MTSCKTAEGQYLIKYLRMRQVLITVVNKDTEEQLLASGF
jgi:hypothetical protein